MWFSELYQYWVGEKDFETFPKRPLILTFDDGYVDNLTNASPLLKKYGCKANLFLLSNTAITHNNWDDPEGGGPAALMNSQQRRSLLEFPWEIGSHGRDHLRLTEVSQDVALDQMLSSKKSLEIEFQKPVFAFAYPFGSTNEKLPELARRADYHFALNTDTGGMHIADDPQSLFRVNVFPEDSWLQLLKKTSSWYRRYFYWKRKH